MTSEPHPRHVAAPAEAILDEVERAVVGKRDVLELVLLALLADGHVLLEDVPGVAKTLIALVRHRDRAALRPRAVHARPAALRRHGLLGLRPAHGELRVPPGAGVLQPAPGR
jgi:MoxR-like ATPase